MRRLSDIDLAMLILCLNRSFTVALDTAVYSIILDTSGGPHERVASLDGLGFVCSTFEYLIRLFLSMFRVTVFNSMLEREFAVRENARMHAQYSV